MYVTFNPALLVKNKRKKKQKNYIFVAHFEITGPETYGNR